MELFQGELLADQQGKRHGGQLLCIYTLTCITTIVSYGGDLNVEVQNLEVEKNAEIRPNRFFDDDFNEIFHRVHRD